MDISELEELRPRLDDFLTRFDDCIKTLPSRRHLRTYVNGQLGPLARKSVEPIALEADVPVRSLQEFLEIHRWDEAKLARRVREIVMDGHADPEAVGVIDETSFAKKGRKTVGIQRQYCGETGKIDNCVVTVHLAYAAKDFAAIVDGDLFLPEHTWSNNPERRREADVPEELAYRPKWRIALDLLTRSMAGVLDELVEDGAVAVRDPRSRDRREEEEGDRIPGGRPLRSRRIPEDDLARGFGGDLALQR